MTVRQLLLASVVAALPMIACNVESPVVSSAVWQPGDPASGDPVTEPGEPVTPTDPATDPVVDATEPPTPSDRALDPFGVEMLNATKSGGEEWFGTGDLNANRRFDPQDPITQNADGSWKMRSTQVRMSVATSSGYDGSKIGTYDFDALASQGYMQAPNDWKNIEMTGYFRVNATNDWSDNIDLYARGGRHNDESPCEGSAYKGQITFDGDTRWAKESWHVSYDFWSYRQTTSSLRARWIGFKAVMRNVDAGGTPGVKLELWLDDDADGRGFVKVYETTDAGASFGDATYCGGSLAQMPITWGGPLAVYRWDSATDVDFRWLSVREIG